MVKRRRDFAGLEQRRLEAGGYFAAGQESQAWIARKLQVSRQSVSRWYREWQKEGVSSLRSAGRAGRKSRLSQEQKQKIAQALLEDPGRYGMEGDGWTVDKVVIMIKQQTGASYHRGHVWKLLEKMDWASMLGAGASVQRRQRWLKIKKVLQRQAAR